MKLFVLGLNHTTASVDIRERASLVPDQISKLLEFCRDLDLACEMIVLSTCNRTEFYFRGLQHDIESFVNIWKNYTHLGSDDILPYTYQYWNEAAVEHLFKVAAGLDSMVLGEPQILGQLKQSLATAQAKNMAGKYLNRLFQLSFNVAKRIRTETQIGAYAVSVAFTAVQLAKQIFDGLENHKILLVGAGETTELVAKHLIEAGVKSITVANRSVERARLLVNDLGIDAPIYPLDDLPELLNDADIIVSSTAADNVLITKEMVLSALKVRKYQPILMIDLAVPRDIDPHIRKLDNVYLYTVDDLAHIVEDNQKSREDAALEAITYINEGIKQWHEWYVLSNIGLSMDKINQYVDKMITKSQHKAMRQLENGKPVGETLDQLTYQLSQRILHPIFESIKQIKVDDDPDLLLKILKEFE